MKRKKRVLLLSIITLLTALCLLFAVACGSKGVTFKFETNGGPAVSSVSVKKGTEYTLPEPGERADYVFEGWYLTDDLSGSPVKSYTANENTTFYAKWSKLYTLTLDAAGGTLENTSLKAKAGTSIASLVAELVPTRQGYQFDEWYYGSNAISLSTVMPEDDITLTAHYKVGYTVHVYLESLEEEGTYEPAEDYVDYARATAAAFTVTYAPEGFVQTSHAGELVSKVLSDTDPAANVFTVYYNRKTISVTFNSNETQTQTKTVSGKYEATIDLPTDFTRSGYLLTGWSTRINGTDPILVTHQAYNQPSVAPAQYQLTEDITLYAVWQQGYVDIFGGVDNIFVIGETIYLYRAGFLFVGEHVANNLYLFTSQITNDILLQCRVFDNGTFCYADESREGVEFYLYDHSEGAWDEHTYLHFTNAYNEVSYVEETYDEADGSLITATSYGEYFFDDDGLMHITFTSGNGSMNGQSITVALAVSQTTGGRYVDVFMIRNEEEYELGTLVYFTFNGRALVSPVGGLLNLTLDGFGNASIDVYGESLVLNYIFASGVDDELGYYELLYLFTDEGETFGLFSVIEVDGILGYAAYDTYSNGIFESADGTASLYLDGIFNATYYGPNGVVAGYYYTYDSYFETVVVFVGGGAVRVFSLDDDQFTEYTLSYKELVYFSNGDVSQPILVMGKEEGKFELYAIISIGGYQVGMLFAEGTLVYNSESMSYVATITDRTEDFEFGVHDGIDFDRLASFVFTVQTLQMSNGDTEDVMIWSSYTLEDDEPVNAEVVYEEANALGGTLAVFNGFAHYTPAGEDTYVGLLSSVTVDGVQYWLFVCADDTFYFEIFEDSRTFVVIDGVLLGTAYLIGEDGMEDKSVSLVMDGKGNASYYADGTEDAKKGKVTNTGTFTDAGLYDNNGDAVCNAIYHFKSDDNSIEFNFIITVDNDGQACFCRESEYIGEYTTVAGDTLTLDGYCYLATFVTYDDSRLYGLYSVEQLGGDEVICFLAYTSAGYVEYYFDVISNEANNKTVRLRGEVREVLVVENQELLDVIYFFDGLGKVFVYEVSDGAGRTLIAEGEYEGDEDGLYTLEITYKDSARTETIEGVFTVMSLYGSYYNVFAIYYAEVVYVYINPADWSVVVLDGIGTALRICYDGYVELGSYIVLEADLIYFANADSSDACLYSLNTSGAQAEINFLDLEEIGYFTQDLDALIFTTYGVLVYENEAICYYNVEANGEVVLYYYADETDGVANKYGFVKKVLDGVSVSDEYPETLAFDNKSFTKNDGARITFSRETKDGTHTYYPLTYDVDRYGEPLKAPLEDLMFTPNGTGKSYSTLGYVSYTMASGRTERTACIVSYEFNTSKEDSHYYILISTMGGGYLRFEIEINYTGARGSTYTVKNMNVVTALDSYRWALLLANGDEVDSAQIGYITLIESYNANGDPSGSMKIDVEFGELSGYVDHNGNLIAAYDIDCQRVVVEDSETDETYEYYTAVFTIDQIKYTLEFQIMTLNNGYMLYRLMDLTRSQTFTGVECDGTTCEVEVITLLGTDIEDWYYSIGMVFDVVITSTSGNFPEDVVVIAKDGKALLFQYWEEYGVYTDKYYILYTTYADSEDPDILPLLSNITLEKIANPDFYEATDSETDEDLLILFNGDEVELIWVLDVYGDPAAYYLIVSTAVNEDGSYTVTTNDGDMFIITKGEGKTATITPVIEEEA